MQTEQAAPPRPFLIGGAEAIGEESQAVIFPYDGSEIARVWLASAADVERALAGAAAAEPLVAAIPPHRRAEILLRAAALVRERADELARQMTLETGIVRAGTHGQRWSAPRRSSSSPRRRRGGLSSSGELVPIDAIAKRRGPGRPDAEIPGRGRARHHGLQRARCCWSPTRSARRFAAGNPCIVRPAPKTPLSALALGAILLEAGAPPEAVTILPSSNELASGWCGTSACGWSRSPAARRSAGI